MPPILGAAFGVWQPRNHKGAAICSQPNSLVWNELQTQDLEETKIIYGAVFGWTNKADTSGYVLFSAADRGQAGAMKIDESWGPVSPNWSVYFLVGDVASLFTSVHNLYIFLTFIMQSAKIIEDNGRLV